MIFNTVCCLQSWIFRLAHLWEPSVSFAASVVCRLSSAVCLSSVCPASDFGNYASYARNLVTRKGNRGKKSRFFGSPPYFYFRFCRNGPLDGRFCLIFDRTAQQSVLDSTNGLSSSKPCVYCRIVRSESKPEVVLDTWLLTQKSVNSLKMPINRLVLPCYKSYWLRDHFLLVARSDHTTGSRNIKPEVVFKVQKMARCALSCFIMGPFKGKCLFLPDYGPLGLGKG